MFTLSPLRRVIVLSDGSRRQRRPAWTRGGTRESGPEPATCCCPAAAGSAWVLTGGDGLTLDRPRRPRAKAHAPGQSSVPSTSRPAVTPSSPRPPLLSGDLCRDPRPNRRARGVSSDLERQPGRAAGDPGPPSPPPRPRPSCAQVLAGAAAACRGPTHHGRSSHPAR